MPLSIRVNYKFAAILLFLLLPQSSNCRMDSRTPDEQSTETTGTASHGEHPTMSRLVRRYDAKGRVSESNYVIEDIEFILPAQAREQLMAEPGASEELKMQLIQLLGAQREFSRNSYIYDAEGRVAEKHFRVGAHQEMITKITYNDNGDKMQEHTTTVGELNPTKSAEGSEIAPTARASLSPQESEVRYGCQYDSFGNWIEQTISSRSSPSEPFTTSTVHHRTITYY